MPRRPNLPDLVFGVVLALALVGGRHAFLNDPGTFWHVALGQQVFASGQVPRADALTYTRPEVPWVDAAWGAEVLMALIVDHLGWGGLVAVSALVLAWVYRAVAAWLIDEGRSPWAAGLAALAAAGVGSCHFLARPHLATIAGVAYTLQVCRRSHRGEGRTALATLPLVIGVWSTLHGGFLAGPFIVACATVGEAVSGPWDRDRARRVGRFATVAVLGLVAPLFGPYGFDLYHHVARLMVTSGVTALIVEHQPTRLADPDAIVLFGVVAALIALPGLTGTRLSRFEMVHVLAWFVLAMKSVRHAPLFGLAVAPTLALLIDAATTTSEVPAWLTRGGKLWSGLLSGLLLIAAALGVPLGGHDRARWPLECVAALDRQPESARLFHDMDWGGLIALECRPARRTFIDDRFELFGKRGIAEYIAALEGGPGWDRLDARERFDLAWVRKDGPLAQRLGRGTDWTEVARDPVSVLFQRRAPAPE